MMRLGTLLALGLGLASGAPNGAVMEGYVLLGHSLGAQKVYRRHNLPGNAPVLAPALPFPFTKPLHHEQDLT